MCHLHSPLPFPAHRDELRLGLFAELVAPERRLLGGNVLLHRCSLWPEEAEGCGRCCINKWLFVANKEHLLSHNKAAKLSSCHSAATFASCSYC